MSSRGIMNLKVEATRFNDWQLKSESYWIERNLPDACHVWSYSSSRSDSGQMQLQHGDCPCVTDWHLKPLWFRRAPLYSWQAAHQEQHLEAGGGFGGSSITTRCFLWVTVEGFSKFSLFLFSNKRLAMSMKVSSMPVFAFADVKKWWAPMDSA